MALVSKEETRALLMKYTHIAGEEKALKFLDKYGCKDITSVEKAGRLQEFYLEVEGAYNELENANG